MKVTLIFPGIREYGGFNSLGKHPECVYVNHGLGMISAVLRKVGHRVNLIDLRECQDWNHVRKKIVESNADVYGVSMQTLDYHEAKECARIIKSIGKISIAGGPHPSICPKEVVETTDFDYIFVGEAEETLPNIIENLNDQDRIIIGEHPDLDSLPFEDRSIWNIDVILKTRHPIFKQPILNVLGGRGCLFNCSFCQPGERYIFGPFRTRSVDSLITEIEELVRKYNYRELIIDDDCFTQKIDYVMEFCDKYEKIKRSFICQSRADTICKHPDVFKRMKEVGLRMLFIGFESGNQRILNLLRKGTKVEQNYRAAEICHELGIEIFANYMLGIPTETKEEAMDTIKMIRTIKPEWPSPAFYTPIVGTDLYDYCKKNDLIISEDPAVIGTRAPTRPKIKGIDYDWLSRQVIYATTLKGRSFEMGVRILRSVPYGNKVKWLIKKYLLKA